MRIRNVQFGTTFLLLVLLSSCTDQNDFRAIDARVKALEEKTKTLQDKVEFNELLRKLDETAFLVPSDEGYTVIKGDLGEITVKLTNVQPYANGSRVTLQFGNISGAAINGLKAKIDWGEVDKDGRADFGTEKSREITFEKQLRANAWTSVPLVLEGIPPARLGYVRVSGVEHRGITLNR